MTLRWVLGALGAFACVATGVLVLDSPYRDDAVELHFLAPVIGASFIGTGLWAWSRRPDQRTGALMVAVGFAWLASSLIAAEAPGVYITGWILYTLPYALLVHLLLAFPSGRLQTTAERAAVLGGYVFAVGLQIPEALLFEPSGARGNPLLTGRNDALFHALILVQTIASILLLAFAGQILARRYRDAAPRQRHALQPVLGGGVVLVVCLAATLLADLTGLSDTVEDVIDVASRLLIAAVPFAFLAGLARSRVSRALAVAALAEQLERGSLRDALAAALGDPTLRLSYAVGDRYVDEDGRDLDELGSHTLVERDGRAVGALLHDPELAADEPEALRAAAAAAALAMENARLQAQRLEDLRASRARLVQAGDAERRRLERDLHDGAQQRLVALALTLHRARNRADGDLEPLLAEAAGELQHATRELRELARGIHPAVLTDRGLGPAVAALAGRAAVPVQLSAVPDERMRADVEAAAYFVVAEALTNVDRYSGADAAEVRIVRADGSLLVEVSDDGIGGADPGAGTGLRGLGDRVAALDGTLEIASPRGGGTTVRARLPCAS